MKETADELTVLQSLLDRSGDGRERHLTDIISPARRLSAAQISAQLTGVLVLNVATVNKVGEPRLSAVDGHFLHGHWYFSTAAAALKARHLAARPAISVSYTPRDGYGIWAHGIAIALRGPDYHRMDAYLSEVYGQPLSSMADGIEIFRVDAHWMIGYAMTAEEQSGFDSTLPDRDRRIVGALDRLEAQW